MAESNLSAAVGAPSDRVAYLQSLRSVRERCSQVYALAEQNKLDYWDVDLSKQAEIVDFCCQLIARDYGDNYASIPPHGRLRHIGGMDRLQPYLDAWRDNVSPIEITRRLIDFCVVSVLLDAGAGPKWTYKVKGSDFAIGRSEGLALASLDMVSSGMFSGVADQPFRVDGLSEYHFPDGLTRVKPEDIAEAMQVSSSNPMVGIEGRSSLLVQLGKVLSDPKNKQFFGNASDDTSCSPRPGNMVDYLRSHPTAQSVPSPTGVPIAVPIDALWKVIIDGLGGVWPPTRTKLDGVALGDVWQCDSLRKTVNEETDALVPFHKLSQWLNYSLIEIIEQTLGWRFTGKEVTTGLPEYRNGGLLIDFGLLNCRPQIILKSLNSDKTASADPLDLPPLPASHSAIVEFRAVTVISLDRIAKAICAKLGADMSLAQVLEAATWKGGREIAKKKRADGGPPINVLLDGTVF
ncbi:hypothetical protein EMMF5_001257 [Cystobasidiomycetes sp. EMM_F5]